jgi:hypothetical protein
MCTFTHTCPRSHVFLVWCFLVPLFSWSTVFFCRVFSWSPVFFSESPLEVPSAEAFTKNLKVPRRRAARGPTTGCCTATMKCSILAYILFHNESVLKGAAIACGNANLLAERLPNVRLYLGLLGRFVEEVQAS